MILSVMELDHFTNLSKEKWLICIYFDAPPISTWRKVLVFNLKEINLFDVILPLSVTPCEVHRVDTLKKKHRVLIHCKTRHIFSKNEPKHAQFSADTLPTPWKTEPRGVTERGSFLKFSNASIPFIMTKYFSTFFPLLLKKDRNLHEDSHIMWHST